MKENYKLELEKEYERLRNNFLVLNGFVEKEVSKIKKDGFVYDDAKDEYYRFIPVKLSDDDLDYLVSLKKKCNNIKNYEGYINLFRIVAIFNLFIFLIFSIGISIYYSSVLIFIILCYFSLIISVIFLGLAKIINIFF